MKEISVFIIDDHTVIADCLRLILNLEDDIKVIGQSDTGEQGIELVRTLSPDIVLMDISMKNMDGVTATSLLTAENNSKIIALTMHDEPHIIHKMLKAGASGYILKDSPYIELVDGIRNVNNGEVYLSKRVATSLVKSHYNKSMDAASKTILSLTNREREILNYLIKGKSNQIIADNISISIKTVLTHRRNLMDKLNCHSLSDLTLFAHENHLL